MKLEYILSGGTFFKVSNKEILNDPVLYGHMREIFKRFNERYPDNNVSLLFNAFTESKDHEIMKKYGVKLYADSGGLQIITRKNMELNDKIKNDIYHTQMNSDYAMCFDEIPLFIDESKKGGGARTDMTGKCVVGEMMYDKGAETGKNVKNQVKVFRENNSKTKAFIILQGNSFEDWMNFSNGVFDQLSEEDYEYIEGLAIADTCIGNGVLEALDMCAIIPKLNCPEKIKKRIHLLGVGSISRLLPILVMVKSGYLYNDIHISYDSTSLSSSAIYGRYTLGSKNKKVLEGLQKVVYPGRVDETQNSEKMDIIYEDIASNIKKLGLGDDFLIPEDEFMKMLKKTTTLSGTKIYKKSGVVDREPFRHYVLTHLMYVISQLINFTEDLLDLYTNDKRFVEFLGEKRKTSPLITLLKADTYEKLKEIIDGNTGIRSFLSSNRIERVDTLEEYETHSVFKGLDEFGPTNTSEMSKVNKQELKDLKKLFSSRYTPKTDEIEYEIDEW